jgi:hypothetical protein
MSFSNLSRIGTAALLWMCCAPASFAEDPRLPVSGERQKTAGGRSADANDRAPGSKVRPTAATATTKSSEAFRNVSIPAGNTVSLDSTIDYSTAATVAVTVECPTCTTSATSLGTQGLVLQARWSTPDADSYVATEYRSASAFNYWDCGGAIFSTYGPQFRLTLQNTGSQAILVQQVTLFRRGQ